MAMKRESQSDREKEAGLKILAATVGLTKDEIENALLEAKHHLEWLGVTIEWSRLV